MRRVELTGALGRIKDQAVKDALKEVELASAEFNLVDIASAFTIEGAFTETRTLDVGTSTLAETQAFIATLIGDLQRGGESRSS